MPRARILSIYYYTLYGLTEKFKYFNGKLRTECILANKNKKQGGFQMIGDGVGRHNMYADKYNPMTSMRDGEYVKMLQEQGYVGFSIFILLIALSLLKTFYHFKYLAFEFAVIVMLLISMIGANPISTGDKHPLIYWMIIAQIANFSIKKRKYGKIKIVNNYSDV